MRKSQVGKTHGSAAGPGADTRDRRSRQLLDLAVIEPDSLRVSVREVLSTLPEEERRAVHAKLLTGLRGAGVNIGQHLLLLGIPARTTEELTAAEIATLIRYIRINEPRALAALAPVLSDFLSPYFERERQLKASRRAA